LVVLVARDDEGLAQRPDQEDRIARVLQASRAKAVKLGPLEPAALGQLLEYLGLSGSLGARVAQRSAGNPQFAIQLVNDWISRDLLEAKADGLVLREGGEPPVPDDLHDVWSTRIVRLLQPLPSVAGIHLERAAAMGAEIVTSEWDRACDDPSRGRVSERGRAIRQELVERMLDARWIELRPHGFVFVHPMLRESLERIARKANRWQGHHQALATLLEATKTGTPARIGFHLLEAGRPEQAVDLLFNGHDQAVASAGVARGSHVLLPLERAMTEAVLPDTDIRWAGLWRRQAALLRARRLLDDALSHAEHARKHADTLEDDLEWARCSAEMSHALEAKGDLEGALHPVQKAVTRLLRSGQRGRDLVVLLSRMSALGRLMNRVDDAERWASQAIGVLERSGIEDESLTGVLEGELAILAARRKEHTRAVQLFDQAIAKLSKGEPTTRLAEVLNNRGDCLKNLGRWAEAEKAFRQAVDMQAELAIDPTVPRLNLVLCLMHVHRYQAALEATYEVERTATGVFAHVASLCRSVCYASMGDTKGVDRELGPAVERIRKAKYVEPDIVWLAEHGAAASKRSGSDDHAVAFLYLAREQLAALGDEAGVARVSKILGED
ncbi:MAG: tetratricopeptide repeat protein, partial [Myxococcales bacterium]|nr:tetratricopeptide repeat protein [Myxococcales bacterium]